MCPQRFVPESYDAEKLRFLQKVFDNTWEQYMAEHLSRDQAKDEALRAALAQAIVEHADGLDDPVELGRLATQTLDRRG